MERALSGLPGAFHTLRPHAAIQLGCAAVAPKHFRVVKRLAEYGLFHAGGVLVGPLKLIGCVPASICGVTT